MLLQNFDRLWRAEIVLQRRGVWVFGLLGNGGGVNDGLVAAFGENAHDFDLRLRLGVGRVDDPERGLATGDEQ